MTVDLKIERRHLLLREITIDPAFQFRHAGIDKAHVKGLVQVLRTMGELDPVLVWQEKGTSGEPTRRLVLLDGSHRLAAYASAKRSRGGGPAESSTGTLMRPWWQPFVPTPAKALHSPRMSGWTLRGGLCASRVSVSPSRPSRGQPVLHHVRWTSCGSVGPSSGPLTENPAGIGGGTARRSTCDA